MDRITIEPVASTKDAGELDKLLWETLWEPLGLPRDVRQRFKIEGESMELVAKAKDRIKGGLVAAWTGDREVELRHLAVLPEEQGQEIGKRLVQGLIQRVIQQGCLKIYTIARNTSVGFFTKMGFHNIPGEVPEEPTFKRHGILFQQMEIIIKPISKDEPARI